MKQRYTITGNADALALSAGEFAATVADISIVTFLGVHNEIVGIGYLGSFQIGRASCRERV